MADVIASGGDLTLLLPKIAEGTKNLGTQAERTAVSEDRLLDAALKLISERGYDRTSLQSIGDGFFGVSET